LNIVYITEIYHNYLTVKNSLMVTRRSMNKKVFILHRRTIFEELKLDDFNPMLKSADKELADLIVLGLFASFERQLRDEILDKSSKLQEILKYRNWIAHGRNPNDLPSVPSTNPRTTYETILEFVSQMQSDLANYENKRF
jgi:hypothetical protein